MSKQFRLFICVLLSGISLHAQNFTIIDSVRAGAYGTAAWGDYDGDGRKDLAYISQTMNVDSPDMFHIYHNTLSGFELVATLPMLFGPAVAWADFDNDGKQDIVVSGLGSPAGQLLIYRSNGDGSFPLMNGTLEGSSFGAIDAVDFDNDGLIDFAATGIPNSGEEKTIVFKNQGNFQFVDIGAELKGMNMGEMKWCDYDNDGKPDLALSGRTTLSTNAYLYHNEGNDSFSLGTAYMKGASGTLDWFDYNGDGKMDLLLAGMDSTSVFNFLELHRNNGDGTFTKQANNIPVFGEPVATDIADFNGDGKPDICFMGGTDAFPIENSALCIGNNSTNFVSNSFFKADITNVMIAAADIDNDGDQDMIFSNYILRNDATPTNIKDLTEEDIQVYPNPAEDYMVIDATYNKMELVITDILGRRMLSKTLMIGRNNLDVSKIAKGNYILQVIHGDRSFAKTISIK